MKRLSMKLCPYVLYVRRSLEFKQANDEVEYIEAPQERTVRP